MRVLLNASRSSMRRILATLVVVALLFSAGATLADDTSEANELFVEAVKLVNTINGRGKS